MSSPARSFVPNGKQEEFIRMVGLGKHFVNMFCAGNGVGKTSCTINILTNIVFGPQNDWFKHPLFENWPYQKRGRIISDPTTIKAKIIPELEKWFPSNEAKNIPEANFELGKEGKNYVCKIKTNTGWEIDIMSTEQDAKEFESADVGFCLIDEPMPKDKFMATLARGRLGMVVIWGFTPLTYSAWIKDWMDANRGELADWVEAETEDACRVHGVRGILEHINIKRIADSYPEDEKEARIFGKFGHLIGRVHKQFRRKIHVLEPFKVDERRFTVYCALDPHPRTPDHVLYIAVDSKGTKYVCGEIVSEGSTQLLYERMRALEAAQGYRIEARIIDPSAFNDDQHKQEKSVGSMLFDMGMTFVRGSKDLMAGIKRTNDALAYQMNEGKMIRPPEMFVFNTCPVFIKQIEEYTWQEWTGRTADSKQLSARPRDKDDHQCENVHRLLLAEPVHVPYQAREYYSGPTTLEEEESLDPYRRIA